MREETKQGMDIDKERLVLISVLRHGQARRKKQINVGYLGRSYTADKCTQTEVVSVKGSFLYSLLHLSGTEQKEKKQGSRSIWNV